MEADRTRKISPLDLFISIYNNIQMLDTTVYDKIHQYLFVLKNIFV